MVHAPRDCLAGDRHYGLDWLRIAAFILLIFYHIGLFFAPGVWLVKAPHPIEAAAWPMLALEPWRLPLLFVVSGYASHALLGRTLSVAVFLRARTYRLLLPLAFGILVIVPPQAWIAMIEYHGYSAGLQHFWTQDWLGFATLNGVFLPAPEHLWFLSYLWTYTMVLGAVLALPIGRWRQMARGFMEWLNVGLRLVWVPLLPLLFLRIALLFTMPETHGLLHDWVSDVTYVPAFLFGFALAANPPTWRAIERCRPIAFVLAIGSFLILLQIQSSFPGGVVSRSHAVQALDRDAGVLMAWAMILLLLGLAHKRLNFDHPLRSKLGEAVFPFYLVHQTIIVVAGWWLKDTAMSPLVMFLTLTFITIAGCWLFYEIARRAGPMRVLLGMSSRANPVRSTAPARWEPV